MTATRRRRGRRCTPLFVRERRDAEPYDEADAADEDAPPASAEPPSIWAPSIWEGARVAERKRGLVYSSPRTEIAEAPSSSLRCCAACFHGGGLSLWSGSQTGPALAMKGKLRWEREAETASCSRWSNRGRETGELALENNCELRAFLITLLPLLQNCSERYTNSNSI
jgi:hypothetical protein